MAKSARKKSARAKSKSAKPKTAAKPAGSKDPRAALREALLRMVAAGGWRDLSYADIAKDAGLSLSQAYEAYPSKAAILTGIGTVLKDDPLLTARNVRVRRIARRVVIDPQLQIPLSATLVTTTSWTGRRITKRV